MRILGLCGSLQANSKNLALLKVAATSVPPGVELVIFTGLSDLPHFNPDIELSGVPESVLRWRQALAECDAVLVASPEYGFSLPGVLKNGIDQVNQTQQRSTDLATAFERGVPGVELPDVMLELQKANVSFRALTEVRNRFVSAYQEIMNMPI